MVRDWSLITGRGEGYKTGGGACEVLPLRKGGAGKVLAMLKVGGGVTQCFGVVFTWELEVLAILKGGGSQKVSTV